MPVQLQQVHLVSVHHLAASKFYHRSPVSLKGMKGQCPGNILNSRRKKAGACSVPLPCLPF